MAYENQEMGIELIHKRSKQIQLSSKQFPFMYKNLINSLKISDREIIFYGHLKFSEIFQFLFSQLCLMYKYNHYFCEKLNCTLLINEKKNSKNKYFLILRRYIKI